MKRSPSTRGIGRVMVLAAWFGLTTFATPPPKGFTKQDVEYRSSTHRTIVRVYRDESEDLGAMQFRVFREPGKDDDEKEAQFRTDKDGLLLWEGENRASAEVSSDGESIAINHHALSDLGELIVFTRKADGGYQKVEVDFTAEALKLLAKQEGMKKEPDFDHIYCYAETWLNDHTFLGVLRGHLSGESSLSGFWFVYDCKTKRFSFDVNGVNKMSYHVRQRDEGKQPKAKNH